MRFTVDRLDHLVLNCTDVEKTASWYQRVLGMDREEFGEQRRTALKFGGQKINLRPVDASPDGWVTAAKAVAGSGDLCFIAAVRPDDVAQHLDDCGVVIESGPISRVGALGPMVSVYCRDPDGNLVEVSSYFDDGD
jgi:catechol 2,3-dioxygenase-like lactoylglutathione lyase family enzyme